MTIADFSFYPWNMAANSFAAGTELEAEIKKYKHYARWHEALTNTPAVKKVQEDRAEVNKAA